MPFTKSQLPTIYNGNQKLKAAGVKTNYTQEQISEYIKCSEDPVYFIEKYIKVVSLDKGLVLMKLFPYQKRIIEAVHKNRQVLAMLFRQAGKALSLDTLIPTPEGFKPISDVHVGDTVYGADGLETKVIAENEPHLEKMYKITFDTKEEVIACRYHLWTVKDRLISKVKLGDGKYGHETVTMTSEELYNSKYRRFVRKGATGKDIYTYAYYIPNTKPVQYPEREVRLDPYILGTWLGNDDDKSFENDDIVKSLRYYNLMDNKTIPSDYLFGSIDKRLHLLRGLMDTVGYVSKNGLCNLTFSAKEKSANLVKTAEILLKSLGLKVTKRYKSKVDAWSLSFKVNEDTFNEPVCEKLKKSRDSNYSTRSRIIVDITPIEEPMMCKCIMVDNPEHLYLCTDGFIPTHNSTILAAYITWYYVFNDHKTACILANKLKSASEIFGRSQMMYEELPFWIKPGCVEYNKTSMKFDNGSRAFCSATSSSAVRGQSINMLLVDEISFIPSTIFDEFYAAVIPTISSSESSKLVFISTPNGMNHFYKLWHDSENGLNDFVRVSGHYSEARSEEWAIAQRKLLGDVRFKSEVLCMFTGSAHTLIDGNKIQQIPFSNPLKTSVHDPIEQTDTLFYFKEVEKGHVYAIMVDVSRGRGKDYSAFIVYDITKTPYEAVCTFKNNKVTTLEYPVIINQVSKYYNNSYIVVENNDLGESVANELWYTFENEGVVFTSKQEIKGKDLIGVKTTSGLKKRGQASIKQVIENGQLIINDHRIVDELNVFVLNSKGTYEAQDTKINDDLCTCLWLFGWFIETEYFKQMTDINTNQVMLAQMKEDKMMEDVVPFGYFDSGSPRHDQISDISNVLENEGYSGLTDEQKDFIRGF